MNFYGGQEDDRNRDLTPGGIAKNQIYAGQSHVPVRLQCSGGFRKLANAHHVSVFGEPRIFPHYDLAVAYLF